MRGTSDIEFLFLLAVLGKLFGRKNSAYNRFDRHC
jgi:hypothetical protein